MPSLRSLALPIVATAMLLPGTVDAGAWTLPAGRGWAKVSWFHQEADEWYIATAEPILLPDNTLGQRDAGTRRPYRFDGRYRSKAVFADLVYGVTDRLDVGVQLAWFDQVYADDTRFEPPSDAGPGDLRVHAKWRLAAAPAVLSLRAGVKAPTGDFRNEDGLVPVGEGQWDYDLSVEVSRSLWPVPLWVHGDLGYRVRTENAAIRLDPGDEWLAHAELGWQPRERAWVALKVESVRGRQGSSFGFHSPSLIRRITYVVPTASVTLFRDLAAEAALRWSLSGRNYPAGPQWMVGLSLGFDGPFSRRRRPRAAPDRG